MPALIGGISHGQGVAGLKIQAAEGRTFQIAFQARSGGRYQVQYSEDLRHWLNAGPPLTTTEAEVWWTDTGPPLTNVHPGQVPARFYRVLRVE